MRLKRNLLILGTATTVVAATALVLGQGQSNAATAAAAPKLEHATLNFESKVGSFKLLGANDVPAEGSLVFSFRGTVLVSGLQGTVTPSGNVRKEYDNAVHKKTIYHGDGKLAINGKVSGVQFFGRDLNAKFDGWGIVRLFGEFDKNLDTGSYWFADGVKKPWGSGGLPVYVPQPARMGGGGVEEDESIKVKDVKP